FNLRSGETALGIARFAQQRRRIELAGARLVQEAVLDTVLPIASRKHSFVQHVGFGSGNNGSRILQSTNRDTEIPRMEMRLIIGGSPRNDRIKVFGIPLRFHQSLPAAGRTAIPVGVLDGTIVVSGHDRLRLQSSLMNGAVCEIDQLFGMVDG